jgi:hypothetical protein
MKTINKQFIQKCERVAEKYQNLTPQELEKKLNDAEVELSQEDYKTLLIALYVGSTFTTDRAKAEV